ncbi:hypothetical protein CVD28_12485 [Bacillus sp. M6-12]|uniref:hypothetical protein n=1 Tax=Bacillus sp. M6-12 TaxID=2054166 RepID=UPI000C7715F3|nr:hypothetical protein [Bacillus sp. M6-12]PLS17375.1 hypothetical protein CVD28_12485 [Bacillus sp. M6-12]
MLCICEELDQAKYGLAGKVAIVEDKKAILKHTGLRSEDWLYFWDIDCRLLTGCFHSAHAEYEKIIVVYDYEVFCSEPDIREAILFHELGHLAYPVASGEQNLEAELNCDLHAVNNGYKNGLAIVLELLLKMSESLRNTLLADMTKKRLEMLYTA